MGWAVTPTSLFALLGLFYWQLSESASLTLWYRIVLFLPPLESTQGARWAHLGCVKDQKHVRARPPYKASVTPGPFASYHARRLELSLPAPKPTLSYPLPTRCMERKGSERSGFLWLIWSSFRRKQGGMGAAYGRYGKSGAGHHTSDLPTLYHPLPDPYPLKTIP